VGVVAGYSRSLLDPFLMRGVDVLLSVPSLLLILLLVSALGAGIWVVIVGVALVLIPPIARVVRAVTLETATRSYVEAAELRGESTASVLWREILPNALPVLLADFGIRFGAAVILIASINYLGFGLQPPAADWGVMIAENQAFVTLNVWSVLAPAIMLALLTVGVNLAADAYVRTLARSDVAARPASHELASETRASGDAASSGSALTATAAPGTE
jgi:ABC-type dipeptide/oligopeptide/nickel transport system permease subunit